MKLIIRAIVALAVLVFGTSQLTSEASAKDKPCPCVCPEHPGQPPGHHHPDRPHHPHKPDRPDKPNRPHVPPEEPPTEPPVVPPVIEPPPPVAPPTIEQAPPVVPAVPDTPPPSVSAPSLPETGASPVAILATALTFIAIGVLVIQAATPKVQPTPTGSR